MEHVCSSRKSECLFIDPNMENFHEILNSNHQDQEPPFFSSFPSPCFDDTSLLTKNHTHQQKPPCLNIDTMEPLPCESKRLIKKRSVGKKDRHSKIHTAQGLRDRRMRLSLEIARKFFDLQDLLGFDKASNTIEWLFSKSNKAIKEVAQNFDSQSTSHDEEDSCQVLGLITKSCISEPEKKKMKNDVKQIPNNNSSSVVISCCRETSREQKRARARDRTRERVMMKQLEKSSKPPQLFVDHPKDEIYKLGLHCCLTSPNNQELGFISPSAEPILQDSSLSPSLIESPNFLRQLQSSSTIDFENYSGIVGYNSPAGWLNFNNGGEWDDAAAAAADRFISEYYYNYEIGAPTTAAAPLTGTRDETTNTRDA